MSWPEKTIVDSRREFVALARAGTVPMRELCRRFGISHTTGYALLQRLDADPDDDLTDRSRRPHTSPGQTAPAVVARVLAIRQDHPSWGGRKIHHRLRHLGVPDVPAPSTITAILRREGCLGEGPAGPRPWQRFTAPAPNALWQLDGLGARALRRGTVRPLSLLDDHSRYGLGVLATATQTLAVVQGALTGWFRTYGLPAALLTDNGPPWGSSGMDGLTRLEIWLIHLGIIPVHGRPGHPQTQGKVERWHGTIGREVFGPTCPPLADLAAAQIALDRFRQCYNHERPHEALGFAVPASRYTPSPRPFPETLPELVYADTDTVQIVYAHGVVAYRGRRRFVGRGLAGQPVGIRETATDGVVEIRFGHRLLTTWNLRDTGVAD